MPQDHTAAVAWLWRACDTGLGAGCADLAFLYARAEGFRHDAAMAASFRVKACALGDRDECDTRPGP